MDMGSVALAGGFLKPSQFAAEKKYQLALGFCPECYAVQVMEPVPPAELFSNYFYFSSATKTAKQHFEALAGEIETDGLVVEIGCNDGVLLEPLKARGIKAVGVDPSGVCQAENVIQSYFNSWTAEVIRELHGKASVIVACNVFAHVEDPSAFTDAAKSLLDRDGYMVIEVHSLGDMVSGLQYDWIYHEHRYYYSLLTLMRHFERHGMSLYDVEKIPTHGGSLRVFVDHGKRGLTERVRQQMREEIAQGLDRVETFHDFAGRAADHAASLKAACRGVVAGYGASGRANTLIQYAGLELAYIVDDAPAKHGYCTPGSHIPIVSRERLEEEKPDRMLVLAWPYFREIAAKCPWASLIVPQQLIRTARETLPAWRDMDGIGQWRAA